MIAIVHQQTAIKYFDFSNCSVAIGIFWIGERLFSARKSTILVIDGNRSILRVFRRLLEKNGYQVVTAETGKEAVEKLHCTCFDAALVDLELPDIEGANLLFEIKKMTPETVKIIFSGLRNLEDDNCKEVFLEKPVPPTKLLKVIDAKLQETKQ